MVVVQTYSSTKHHIILISKRKLRIYGLVTLILGTAIFALETRSLYSPWNDFIVTDDPELLQLIRVAEIHQNEVHLRPNRDIALSASALFPSSRLEEVTCSDAKSSGRCVFEGRHLPFHFPASANSTVEDALRLRFAVKLFEKLSNKIGLVVTFNKAANYEVAPLIEAFYRTIFVKIIFCGPSTSSESFRLVMEQYHGGDIAALMAPLFVSYTPRLPDLGENVYACFNLAVSSKRLLGELAERSLLDGVFVMADDVLLNYWNLFAPFLDNNNSALFDFDRSYAMPTGVVYDTDTLNACHVATPGPCLSQNPWPNWPKMYQTETATFYRELEHLASRNGSMKLFSGCLQNLIARTGGPRRVLQSPSDFFYVARQHFTTAVGMFELADRFKIFQEVAVQTTFACFDESTSLPLDGTGDNTDGIDRKMPWAGYRADWLFMHPFKLSLIVNQAQNVRNYYLSDRCLFCMLAEFSKQFRYNLLNSLERINI